MRLSQFNAGLHASDDAKKVLSAQTRRESVVKREPCFEVFGNARVPGEQQTKVWRHDADYDRWFAIDDDILSDNRRIAPITPLPDGPTQ